MVRLPAAGRTRGVLRYEATTDADRGTAWSLIARPGRWSAWAPHVRGAWGLGDPEVRAGARGAARLLGVVPMPATITAVRPGRSWAWRVGAGPLTVTMDHRVGRRRGRTVVGVDLVAPPPVERVLAVTYGPLVGVLLRRLAAVAERQEG